MTVSVVVAAPKVEIETEAVQRTLAVAKRALRAREATLVLAEAESPTFAGAAMLSTSIAPFGIDIAKLVVTDEPSRQWSAEDAASLRDVASLLTAALRSSEELRRLRAVVDNVPGLIFERRKDAAADARYTFLGSCKAALPVVRDLIEHGSVESEWRFVHADDRPMLRDALRLSIAEERDLDITIRVEDGDGETHWVRSRAAVRRDDADAVVWSGVCLDITEVMARSDAVSPDPAVRLAAIETAPAPDLGDPTAAPDDKDPSSMLNILLADDLDLNRKLICDMLSLDGYNVDSVADGAAAVEAVKGKSYDLVLMDMIMPGMDGMDATRAIRALPAPACDVPIVALTAHSFREQLDNCLHAGMNATLTKPMSFEALSSAVSLWARSRPRAA